MRTIEKKVYSFAELLEIEKAEGVSGRVVNKVRSWLQNGNLDWDWWSCVTDDWQERLGRIGFVEAKIEFSGFGSQGDGASFTSEIDLEKLAGFFSDANYGDKDIQSIPRSINPQYGRLSTLEYYVYSRVVRTSHQYSHENTCQVEIYLDNRNGKGVAVLLSHLENDAQSLRLRLCRSIYHDLQSEYDYRCSDECLVDFAEANQYTFDIHGHPEFS